MGMYSRERKNSKIYIQRDRLLDGWVQVNDIGTLHQVDISYPIDKVLFVYKYLSVK